ncbi:guanine deaminase-like [Amphiura filiformis]|uniref:guanine deaminase-like n=1 Tax=Amphiura filiformis TaxID=82378 RepID=UPI003B228969
MNGINKPSNEDHFSVNGNDLQIFQGTLIHATNDHPLLILEDHVIGVGQGKIAFVAPSSELSNLIDRHGFQQNEVRQLQKGNFLMPGFVDTHIHAPQYVYAGTGTDLPLLSWLTRYTIPVESKFKDLKFASLAYNDVVETTLKVGTTTACYYATIHKHASLRLAEIAANLGQRAFVGKVNMDTFSPDYYLETTQESIRDTEWFIEQVRELNCPRVNPIITPRFALSCTSPLMTQLGVLADKYDVHIQTHINESLDEIASVKEKFPGYGNYARVYDAHGLMNNKTVLAHCIHMEDDEVSLIKERGAGVAHCPCSNFTIMSGVMNLRERLQQGLKVGLATDVSGGYSSSMLVAMRQAVIASRVHSISLTDGKEHIPVEYHEAFRLATLGGSEVLGLSDKIGNFEVGKEFDALIIDPHAANSPFHVYDTLYTDTIEDIVQKFLYLGDDRNIAEVYVGGERVKPRT